MQELPLYTGLLKVTAYKWSQLFEGIRGKMLYSLTRLFKEYASF